MKMIATYEWIFDVPGYGRYRLRTFKNKKQNRFEIVSSKKWLCFWEETKHDIFPDSHTASLALTTILKKFQILAAKEVKSKQLRG